MGERRGDHGTPGRHGVDKHAGCDLFLAVVRQHDEIGRGDEVGQGGQIPVGVVEGDVRGDAGGPGPPDQHVPVLLPRALLHLRVRRPGDEVLGEGFHAAELGQRVDGPLDALARPEQPPGQQLRPAAPRGGGPDGLGRRRTVGDDVHLGRVDAEPVDQPVPAAARHDHDGTGGPAQVGEHAPLPLGRRLAHGVRHHDRRDGQPIDQLEDLVAVRTRVDPVLVLDDRHVGAIEHVGTGAPRAEGTGHGCQDQRVVEPGTRRDPHDVDGVAPGDQAGGQRSGERGDAAGGRRERPEHAERAGARRTGRFRGKGAWHERSDGRLRRGVEPAG